MTDAEMTDLLSQLGGHCARAIVSDPRFEKLMRQWVREAVQLTVVQAQDVEEMGIVRSFVQCCQSRGVRLTVDRQGRIWAKPRERLGEDLAEVLVRRREAIAEYLAQAQELTRRQEDRERPPIAGKIGGQAT